ncbi:hypothetical protein M8998_03945 [Sphingobacterium sp. lm-10]|uniref:hypothetical protein n=1 Tax=Sphingobacterium sp. lm-10 TaxID=2944904 RepID=UPI002020C81B|nr:hypothetical protein [Sphingobacterium sp. lm-10]MCL7987091.1 hypothetical protein [Sphingobacterium sp. lm-10]
MIFLSTITDSIMQSHLKYFKTSTGYSNLIALSNDNSIPPEERQYFLRLTDDSILQSIILGTPDQLRKEIEHYQTYFAKKYPLLIHHQAFLNYLDWDDVYVQINRLAEVAIGKTIVIKTRKQLYKNFTDLIEKLNTPELESRYEIDIFSIKNIKKIFDTLKNYFSSELGQFYSRIQSVFDYDDFIREKEEWYAYKLTEQLGVNVCPYCNRNYIHTSIGKFGRTRAEIDHFYPKSKYPFLAISLYNLIPSCHVCNSNLKRSKDFYTDKHIHPYEHNYTDDFRFEISYKPDPFVSIIPEIEDFTIVLTPLTDDDDKKEAIMNSDQTFQIAQLHGYHRDIAQELLLRSVLYNKTRITELEAFLGKKAGINNEFLKRVIIGNYGDMGSFGKRPLAKYSYDILSKTDLKKNLDL